jgi:tetratricopeptide (TPR) repeat protein
MAIFTRFECPRCQHVFVREGSDDAFSDCPNCQSMALAIGEASAEELAQLQSSIETQQGAPADSGVFSGLLSESTGGGPLPDVTADDLKVPATLDEIPAQPQEFDEATAASELPASLALTRASVEGGPITDEPAASAGFDPFADVPIASDEEDIHVAPTHVLNPESQATEVLENPFADGELDVAFDESLDEDAWENGPPSNLPAQPVSDEGADEDAWENGPPSNVTGAAPEALDEDAWENGPPAAALPQPPSAPMDVPSRPPSMAITHEEPTVAGAAPPSPPSAVPAPAFDSGFFPQPGTNAGQPAAPLSAEEFNVAVHDEPAGKPVGPADRQGVWDPAFQSGEMGQEAFTLDQIEGQMAGAVSLDSPDAAGLADAFSQLEAAFDDAAAAPEPAPQSAQEALRAASAAPQHSHQGIAGLEGLQGPDVPMPPSADEPPPMRRVRQRGHLTLSEEAKALAGIPIQPEAGSANLALALTRSPDPAPVEMSTLEAAPPDLEAQPPALELPAEIAQQPAPAGPEVTDPVQRRRPQGAKAEEEPEPGAFAGFSILKALLIVFVFVVVGGGVGALTAPKQEKAPLTQRERAEQKFSRGNRFYEEGRIDDALGEYRGSLSLDDTFAPAHRAKAAALAKLKRHEEAARAYAKYLEASPSAVDASEVREVLARWEGKSP